YIARKALMKKYGVTNWRAFEKTSNNIAELRSTLKASLIKNTVGKVAPKASTYLTCLSGGSTCEKLKDSWRSQIDDSPQKRGPNGELLESDDAFANRMKKNEV